MRVESLRFSTAIYTIIVGCIREGANTAREASTESNHLILRPFKGPTPATCALDVRFLPGAGTHQPMHRMVGLERKR